MRATTAFAAAYRKRVTSIIVTGVLMLVVSVSVGTPMLTVANAAHAESSSAVHGKGDKDGTIEFSNREMKRPNHASERAHAAKPCPNRLVKVLKKVGFKGANLREAWAIAMRESHGHPRVISRTWDVGLYQFNRAAHSKQDWWNVEKLRTAKFNAHVAYKMSRGGKTWYPWGLDGHGNVKAHVYRNIGWSEAQIQSHIVAPFRAQLKEFDRLPKSCRA